MPDQQVIRAIPTLLQRLKAAHPDARYELDWDNPLQLLVATILAAQCTDERVNKVTPGLFAKYPDAQAFATANMAELEELLKPTGYYREKAKKVQAAAQNLVDRFQGEVPRNMDDLVTLPGVARKTANVVLTNAYRLPTGIIVDTHVQRVSQRMGLTDQKNPDKIERDLMNIVPREEWIFFGPATVLLGRYTCTAHAPRCSDCVMQDLCPKRGVGEEGDSAPEDSAPEEDALAEEDSQPMATRKPKTTKAKPAAKKKTTPSRTTPAAARSAASKPAHTLQSQLPADWQTVLAGEFSKSYFRGLEKFVAEERAAHQVFPLEENMFSAFRATPYEAVKVLLLGQDPYHDDGQAHGMCFSVLPGVKPPPSLLNIYKELQDDLGITPPEHGFLASWAAQGVMLLNAVLTVRAHEAASHKEKGWETFTDAVIQALSARARPMVFLLWGAYAQKKAALIDTNKHRVLPAAHPSPLSAKKFFGSKPFSQANKALQDLGQSPVNWQLPADPTQVIPTGEAAPAPSSNSTASRTASAKAALAAKPEAPRPAPAPAPAVVKEPATVLDTLLPDDWRTALAGEFKKPYFKTLDKFLANEWDSCCPTRDEVFRAFHLCPLRDLRVIILGQEPPCDTSADGLAHSVKPDAEITLMQEEMFQSLREDLGCRMPVSGHLESWARQGVLLLNSILTVRAGKPGSHKDKGWETFTAAVLSLINERSTPVVFALWGQAARKKRDLINEERHAVLTAENPEVTPEKFHDERVFSSINNALELRGQSAVYWQLPYV